MVRNKKNIVFSLVFLATTIPIVPLNAVNKVFSPESGYKKMPSKAEIQQLLINLDQFITQAELLLTSFESGVLDKMSIILSQKKEKLDTNQIETAEEIIASALRIRQSIYQGRTDLFDNLKQSMQNGFSPGAISQFMHGLAAIMRLAAQFGSYLEKAITAKLYYEKSFDMIRYIQTSRTIRPQETLVDDIFSLQHSIFSISGALDHFDETKINTIALFIENNIISPFFKYNIDQVLWYAGCWGGIATLLLWKLTQGHKAQREFDRQRKNNLIDNTHISGQKKIEKDKFFAGEKGIFENRKSDLDPLKYTTSFSKTRGFFERFGDFLEKFFGHSEDYFVIEGLQNLSYHYTKMKIVGKENLGKMYYVDKKVTDIVKQNYPLITVLATMVWPTFKENWDKNVWPSIKGNIKALWNKALGGMYEKRAIEGDFLIFPEHTLDDLTGIEQEKEELNVLIEFLLNPTSFAQQHGNKITKAFLFTGPTRTGKTYLYRAFVGSLQQRLRLLSRSVTSIRAFEFKVDVVKQYGISNLLKYIKQQAPAVAFIDEVDLIQLQRSTDTVILADFLTGLALLFDGDPSKPVLLFFATNKSQHLDDALKTKGRFGKEIAFDYPSVENRKKFLLKLFKTFNQDASKFDIDAIVQQLNQQSYEAIEHLFHESMMKSSIKGVPFNQSAFDAAIDNEILKILSSDRKDLTPREWDILAAHFAGQALIFLLMHMPEVLHKITICAVALTSKEEHVVADVMQKDEEKQKKVVFGNTFTMTEGDTEKLATRELIVNQIKRLLSGFIAEEILLGSCGATCHPEYKDEAYNKVVSLLLGGIKFDKLPDHQKTQISNKAFELLEQYTKEIHTLFMEHKELLKVISDTLSEQKTLTASQLRKLKEDFEKQKSSEHEVEKIAPSSEIAT